VPCRTSGYPPLPLQPQMVTEGAYMVIYFDDYWTPFAPHPRSFATPQTAE
jgi:hypothetical protein